jgi:hypothetical protein
MAALGPLYCCFFKILSQHCEEQADISYRMWCRFFVMGRDHCYDFRAANIVIGM